MVYMALQETVAMWGCHGSHIAINNQCAGCNLLTCSAVHYLPALGPMETGEGVVYTPTAPLSLRYLGLKPLMCGFVLQTRAQYLSLANLLTKQCINFY